MTKNEPTIPEGDGPRSLKRRDALGVIALALGAVWTLLAGAVAAVFGASPLRANSSRQSVSIGKLGQFSESFRRVQFEIPIGDGWYAQNERATVFVRMDADGEPMVLSGTCTHLGCTVRWASESNEFHCPCHGGRYTAMGTVAGGPPDAPLRRLTATEQNDEVVVEFDGTHA